MSERKEIQPGKVIPFQQGSSFYLKRGAKKMERNDPLGALLRYRKAYESDPGDGEACLAVAEILSQMQRFEESNRILFRFMANHPVMPECFFGLACNYYGLHSFDQAADSLEKYLDIEPDGYFAADAEDFLDFLEDDEAMEEATGLLTDEDYETDAVCIHARRLMDALRVPEAIALLEKHVNAYPEAERARNQLALAYYCNREKAKALAVTQTVLDKWPDDVQALCNKALFLHSEEDLASAEAALNALIAANTEMPEELHNVAVLQIEFAHYDAALQTLSRLSGLLPYDPNVLHMTGYCKFMLGDAEGAQKGYKTLLFINPSDTVARYYLGVCKRGESAKPGLHAKWILPYQVPFAETFRRLNQINKLISQDHEMHRLWAEDAHFRDLITWALELPEERAKRSMLTLVFTLGGRQAENVLRDFLLATAQPDDLKRVAFGLLKRLGAKEPYAAYLDGQWVSGKVSMIQMPEKLPPSYEAVMQNLMEAAGAAGDEACAAEALKLLYALGMKEEGQLPRISRMQEISFAAGLEYLAHERLGTVCDEAELIKRYRITPARLHNAVEKLRSLLEEH